MSTYNGQAFLKAQLDSILPQLNADDEIVVVDDCSRDDTVAQLQGYHDARIRVLRNAQNRGAVRSFEKAILAAQGSIIFLSDQDDVWLPGRLDAMVAALRGAGGMLVVSNYDEMDQDGKPVVRTNALPPLRPTGATGNLHKRMMVMLGKINYFGCAMAFTSDFAKTAAPFPPYTECHDLWLASVAIQLNGIVHMEQSTLLRRLHGSNLSLRKRPLWQKLRTRVGFMRMFIAARARASALSQ